MLRTPCELCIENAIHLDLIIKAKHISQVELCDNLAVGGTTVSYGVALHVARVLKAHNKTLMLMIRPRGGDFIYSPDELNMMLADMHLFNQIEGVGGFVFGALTAQKLIDKSATSQLIKAAKGKLTTFHMAFDHISFDQQLATIDWLAAAGVKSILVHGSPKDNPIEQNIPWLKELNDHAQGKLILRIGKGVTLANARSLARRLPGAQLHGTRLI